MLQCKRALLLRPSGCAAGVIPPAMPAPKRRIQQLRIEPVVGRQPATRTRRLKPTPVRGTPKVMFELMDIWATVGERRDAPQDMSYQGRLAVAFDLEKTLRANPHVRTVAS